MGMLPGPDVNASARTVSHEGLPLPRRPGYGTSAPAGVRVIVRAGSLR
jgi:hypothetical protein